MEELKALRRNKIDLEVLRQFFINSSTKYDKVKLAVNELSDLPPAVLKSYLHVSKYVKLVNIIFGQQRHLDHIKPEEWHNVALFLFESFQIFTDSIDGELEYLKYVNDIFKALSMLMTAIESINMNDLPQILRICTEFVESMPFKENTCTLFIMRTLRHMVQVRFEEAIILGSMLMTLPKPKNQNLIYEMLVYGCLNPQPLDVISALSPPLIGPDEVEFSKNTNFDYIFTYLRPSSNASLSSFVAAVALVLAETPSLKKKRQAIDASSETEIHNMIHALRGINEPVSYPDSFWSFVHTGKMLKKPDLELFKLCLDNLNSDFTSGVCFCLSKLVSLMMSPDYICDLYVHQLLELMKVVPSIKLCSGLLHLIMEINDVKVLDSRFQFEKAKFNKTMNNCSSEFFSTEYFDLNCQPGYLDRNIFMDLIAIDSFLRFNEAKNLWNPELVLPRKNVHQSFLSFPTSLAFPSSYTSAREVLWGIACSAKADVTPINLKEIKDQFILTKADYCALVWFTKLFYYFNWSQEYLDTALNLCKWELSEYGLIDNLPLYKDTATNAIQAYQVSPCTTLTGIDLRPLAKILNNYAHQKSYYVESGILKLVSSSPQLRDSEEGKKLVANFLKQALQQSSCSRISHRLKLNFPESSKPLLSTSFNNFDLAISVYSGESLCDILALETTNCSDVKSFAQMYKISTEDLLYYIATPLLMRYILSSDDDVDFNKYQSHLVRLNAPDNIINKQKQLFSCFQGFESLNSKQKNGLIQQILLDHLFFTTNQEKILCIEKLLNIWDTTVVRAYVLALVPAFTFKSVVNDNDEDDHKDLFMYTSMRNHYSALVEKVNNNTIEENDLPDVQDLWHWTKKLNLYSNVKWMALLGRLGISNSLSPVLDFASQLKRIYYELPFDKKWYLNAFIQSLKTRKITTLVEVPLELDLYELLDYGLPRFYSKAPTDVEYDILSLILNESLKYYNFAPIGSHILEKVPELISLLPELVGRIDRPTDTIISVIEQGLEVEVIQNTVLEIIERYVFLNKKCICDYEKAINASKNNTRFASLGFLLINLQWTRREPFKDEDLQFFYKKMTEKDAGFQDAIKENSNLLHLTMESKWHQLQLNLVEAEVRRNSDALSKNLESANLWHISQNFVFYNCEEAWWKEWDVKCNDLPQDFKLEIDNIISSSYEHPEFLVIHRYLSNDINIDDAYAYLAIVAPEFCSELSEIVENRSTTASAVVRQGREIRFSDNKSLLTNELETSCRQLRNSGQIDDSLKYAMKLNLLLGDHGNIELAQTIWALGKQEIAIEALKTLPKTPEIFQLMGTWSHLAKYETDSTIVGYFEEAIRMLDERTESHELDGNGQKIEKVHHAFAAFCEDRLVTLNSEITESEGLKIRNQKLNSGNTGKINRLIEAEDDDYNLLVHKRRKLLVNCVTSYMFSLQFGDSQYDMARLISIWLENNEVEQVVDKRVLSIPSWKFIPWMNQLSSRLGSKFSGGILSTLGPSTLQKIVLQACTDHPYHSVWQLINIVQSNKSDAIDRQKAALSILEALQLSRPEPIGIIREFAFKCIQQGHTISKTKKESSKTGAKASTCELKPTRWWTQTLPTLGMPVPTCTLPLQHDCDYSSSRIPYIVQVDPVCKIAGGVSAPIILRMKTSDGETKEMLLKGSTRDDLRQDAIMQQVLLTVNRLLSKERKSNVRTYNVIPLGDTFGAIEFVSNTRSLMEILDPLHKKYGKSEYSRSYANALMGKNETNGRNVRIYVYKNIMEHMKPQMRLFWMSSSTLEHYLNRQNTWCRSNGIMSIIGYILGLGDRHCSNLLLDMSSGEVVHIDFGIAFGQGRTLSIPETVPFRLTRDMVDGMGVQATNGVFLHAAKKALAVMRAKKEMIMTVLEVLKLDTLYSWVIKPEKIQENIKAHPEVSDKDHAELAVRSVRSKLNHDLSCSAEVRELVIQATDIENLALIYRGWSPYY